MLALDNPRWKELRQAHGSAKSTPKLLNELFEDSSKWDDIWGSLCHQGDIYSGTYAAVPHLVSKTDMANLKFSLWTLIFCGTVQSRGNLVGGPVPADLIEPFDNAIMTMQEKSLPLVKEAISQNALKDFPLIDLVQAAYALHHGGNPECPECDAEYMFDSEVSSDITPTNFEKLILNQEGTLTCSDCECSFSL